MSSPNDITLEEGVALTQKFNTEYPNAKRGFWIARSSIEELLKETECTGLRIYIGMDKDSEFTLVVVGTDEDKRDITTKVMDKMLRCPTACDNSSPL